jgi:hypothetical protein
MVIHGDYLFWLKQAGRTLHLMQIAITGLPGECVAAVIHLPVHLFDAVDTGQAPWTRLHALIMLATPRAVPGKRRHRCIQPPDNTAQFVVPGFGFHFRIKVGAGH